MEMRVVFYTVGLCFGVLCWAIFNIRNEYLDFHRHKHFTDQKTGAKLKPRNFFDITTIIEQSDAYINRTNAQERLYHLQHNINLANTYSTDQEYSRQDDLLASGWPTANQSKCGHDLHWILSSLEANKNYTFLKGRLGLELTQLMDSFGKLESGLHRGVVDWVGSYSQCELISLNRNTIRTRYCTARMRPSWWPTNETMVLRPLIRIGGCLPESCDTLSAKYHDSANSIARLVKYELPDLYRDGLEFESLFCLPDERSPVRQLPTGARIYLSLVGLWLSLIVGATIYCHYNYSKRRDKAKRKLGEDAALAATGANGSNLLDSRKETLELRQESCETKSSRESRIRTVLEGLSIERSIKTFMSDPNLRLNQRADERPRVVLACLDFFKVLMAFIIVFGHSAFISIYLMRSLANKLEMLTEPFGCVVMSIQRIVETFYLIFGLLMTYNLMRRPNLNQLASPLVWLDANVRIALRITPVFILVYWYANTVAPYTGAGPWWDYGVYESSLRGLCRAEHWWVSIPHLGSFGKYPLPICVLPSWFLVVYAQLGLLVPLFTFLLIKMPSHRWRFGLAGFMSLVSWLQFAIQLYNQQVLTEDSFTTYGLFLSDIFHKYGVAIYIGALGRVGYVVMGCLVGYFLRQYELANLQELPHWLKSKSTLLVVLALHVLIIIFPAVGHWFHNLTGQYIPFGQFVFSYTLMTFLWPLANALLFIILATVRSEWIVARFCSHTFWRIINRLGFAIYLVHWEVITHALTSFEQGPSRGFWLDIFKTWAWGLTVSLVVAFMVYILFEAPLATLITLALQSGARQPREPTRSTSEQQVNLHSQPKVENRGKSSRARK